MPMLLDSQRFDFDMCQVRAKAMRTFPAKFALEVLESLIACEKIPARSEGAAGRVRQGAGVPISGSVASSA